MVWKSKVLIDSRRESVAIPMEVEITVLSSSKPSPPYQLWIYSIEVPYTTTHSSHMEVSALQAQVGVWVAVKETRSDKK